jgi:succinate dehydrogenase / fumarate reductase iron-sulfur subunit
MLINGKVRQACSALVDKLAQPINVEPLTSFPVVRDLIVDRSRIFEAFKKVHAWVPIDGTYDWAWPQDERERAADVVHTLHLHRVRVVHGSVPQLQRESPSSARRQSTRPGCTTATRPGAMHRGAAGALIGEGGIAMWQRPELRAGLPKGIPLTEAIAEMNRQVNLYAIRSLFTK